MPTCATVAETRLGDASVFVLTSPDGRLRAVAAPHDGGGVSSLMADGHGELLYRANQFAPPPAGEWMGRAPLLWPAVGRNFTPAELAKDEPQCGFELNDHTYPLPIHGFARHKAWTPLVEGADEAGAWVTFGLTDDAETHQVYPFRFNLEVTHRLDDGGLSSTVTLVSEDAIPFCIGNHLTVLLPDDGFEQVMVASNVTNRHLLNSRSLLSAEVVPEDLSAGRPMADESLWNAVLGGLEGTPQMTVTWPDGFSLRVTQSVGPGRELVRPDLYHFVLYANREHHYFCPEPWIGRPNAFINGEDLVRLPADERFEWTMRVEIGG